MQNTPDKPPIRPVVNWCVFKIGLLALAIFYGMLLIKAAGYDAIGHFTVIPFLLAFYGMFSENGSSGEK